MDARKALQLIIAKCPALAHEGGKALQSMTANSPVAAVRAQSVIQYALADMQADFSPQERMELAELLTGDTEQKTLDVRIRVTPDEKRRVQEAATAAGLSVSDYIRRAIDLI